MATLKTQALTYEGGGATLKGYLAVDEAAGGKRPGVLVVHEWWGQNDYVRGRARMLAELGYPALALDMFGDGRTAADPDEAGRLAGEVMQNWGRSSERFMAALDLLKQQDAVDPQHVAAVGYCFGGGVALQMARDGAPLDAVVSFHGSLATERPARPGSVKGKLLVQHGGDDTLVGDQQLAAFREEMDKAGADYRVIVHDGAKHGFTNPEATENGNKFSLPLGYDAQADKASWDEMVKFFQALWKA